MSSTGATSAAAATGTVFAGLRLTVRRPLRQRADCSGLVPSALAGVSPAEVARLPIVWGHGRVPVGEVFDVAPDAGGVLVFDGDTTKLDRIGAGLAGGRIVVRGDCGAWAGAGMRSGTIEISGDADHHAGSAMAGGELSIAGNAGGFLAAPPAGELRGMRGGRIVIGGDVGDRAGERMRRGTIVVFGSVGAYVGTQMSGGTVLVGRRTGEAPGFGMRRGTLLVARGPGDLLPTFADCGEHTLGWLELLRRDLPASTAARLGFKTRLRVRRWLGDAAVAGVGELLQWA